MINFRNLVTLSILIIDATIGNTRIVCNQLGYVYYRENLAGFDGRKFFEV